MREKRPSMRLMQSLPTGQAKPPPPEYDTSQWVRPPGLTDKQWAFVTNYVLTRNHTKAMMLAGYGYPTAETSVTSPMMTRAVRDAVTAIQNQTVASLKRSTDYYVKKLDTMIEADFARISDISDGNFVLKEWDEMPDEERKLINVVKAYRSGITSVELPNKFNAVRLMLQFLGVLTDKVEHTISDATFFDLMTEGLVAHKGRVIDATLAKDLTQWMVDKINVMPRREIENRLLLVNAGIAEKDLKKIKVLPELDYETQGEVGLDESQDEAGPDGSDSEAQDESQDEAGPETGVSELDAVDDEFDEDVAE